MTTHYMDEAEFCDRIAIMDQGEIVALDTPEALKAERRRRPGADRHRRRRGRDRGARATVRDRGPDRRGRGDLRRRRRARSSCRGCSPSSACRSASVSVSRPTLDDVFMSYTGTTIRDAEETGGKHATGCMMQVMTGTAMSATIDRPIAAAQRRRRPRSSASASRRGAGAASCARSRSSGGAS